MLNQILKAAHLVLSRGVLFTFLRIYSVFIFSIYRRKFKSAHKFFFHEGYKIRGCKFIELGNHFVGGVALRMEAIDSYRYQSFSPSIFIGENVYINNYVHIGCVNVVKIGDGTLIGSHVLITDHNHGYYDQLNQEKHESPDVPPADRLLTEFGSVEIGRNVFIGEFVSILAGSDIGDGAVIGSNSVVCHPVPPYSVAVGSPAKVIKKYNHSKKIWERV